VLAAGQVPVPWQLAWSVWLPLLQEALRHEVPVPG
jgi:hypothetical protein